MKNGENFRKGRLRSWWRSVALKEKFNLFTWLVTLTIVVAVVSNVFVVRFALNGFETILEDNAMCYGLSEAVEKERKAFDAYARSRSEENARLYEAACQETELSLSRLPFQYEFVGADRYARTWSIINTYEAYQKKREQVLQMGQTEAGYVAALYEVYDMQEYLADYARQLTQLTLEDSSRRYLDTAPLLKLLPQGILALGICLIFLAAYFTRIMRLSILGPIEGLAAASRKIARNDFSGEDVLVENQDEMGELVRVFNKMKHATEGYILTLEEQHEMAERLHREEMERVEMEKILDATRLEVLKSQINPHFLFNTLNTIACMARLEDADTTEKMITSMSSLFRYNLKTTETEVALAREIKVVDDYLYIQQTRFGDRIKYRKRIQVDEHRVIIPSFSLQPIVENAVLHGLSKKEQGGFLHIRVWRKGERVIISVADSGVGMKPEQLKTLQADCRMRKTSKIGIGLGNIYKRLHMMYEGADLRLYSKEGMGTIVQMEIPLKAGDGEMQDKTEGRQENVSGNDCGR